MKLHAPAEWWQLSREEQLAMSNGCGPHAIEPLIPDSIFGLSIEEACRIHDFMYRPDQDFPKWTADIMFLGNLIDIIEAKGGWLKLLRLHVALTYYKLVREFGRGRRKN